MLPDELVIRLREQGAEARHVCFLKETGLNDQRAWDYACQTGDVVVSKDSNFLALAANDSRAKLIHIKFGNASRAALVEFVMTRYGDIEAFVKSKATVLTL